MVFVLDGEAVSGMVSKFSDANGHIEFTYSYKVKKTTWDGSFEGDLKVDGTVIGHWEEDSSNRHHVDGETSFLRLIVGDRYILTGTWTQSDKPGLKELWTINAHAKISTP